MAIELIKLLIARAMPKRGGGGGQRYNNNAGNGGGNNGGGVAGSRFSALKDYDGKSATRLVVVITVILMVYCTVYRS